MSPKGSDRRFVLVVAAAVMALTGIALLISNLGYLDLGGRYDDLAPALKSITEVVVYILLAILLCIMVYLLYFYTRVKKGGGARAAGRPTDPHALIIAVLVVIGLIAIFGISGGQLIPPNLGGSEGAGGSGGNGGGLPPATAEGSALILVVFMALAILGTIVSIKFIRNRPIRESAAIRRMEGEAEEILTKAMKDLYAGEDARAVIVRTYQQMCRLIGGGFRSAPYLTPHEFAELAVRRMSWPEAPVLQLTALFEEAWYSDHELGEDKKDQALSCLEKLRGALEPEQGRTAHGKATVRA
jgi:hypothetical protein